MRLQFKIISNYDKSFNIGEHFSEELRTLKYQYRIRTYETLSAIKIAMALAPRDVWKCDPSVHKLGKD